MYIAARWPVATAKSGSEGRPRLYQPNRRGRNRHENEAVIGGGGLGRAGGGRGRRGRRAGRPRRKAPSSRRRASSPSASSSPSTSTSGPRRSTRSARGRSRSALSGRPRSPRSSSGGRSRPASSTCTSGHPTTTRAEAIEADVSILAKNSAAAQKENGAWAMLNQLHNEKLNAWYLTHIHAGVNFFLYTSKPHQDGRFGRHADPLRAHLRRLLPALGRGPGPHVPARMSAPPSNAGRWTATAGRCGGWSTSAGTSSPSTGTAPASSARTSTSSSNLDRWTGLGDLAARVPQPDDGMAEHRVAQVARRGGREPGEDARGRGGRVRGPRGGGWAATAESLYWEALGGRRARSSSGRSGRSFSRNRGGLIFVT